LFRKTGLLLIIQSKNGSSPEVPPVQFITLVLFGDELLFLDVPSNPLLSLSISHSPFASSSILSSAAALAIASSLCLGDTEKS